MVMVLLSLYQLFRNRSKYILAFSERCIYMLFLCYIPKTIGSACLKDQVHHAVGLLWGLTVVRKNEYQNHS